MGVRPGGALTGGRVSLGRWRVLTAQVRKGRADAWSRWPQVACQVSRPAWLRRAGPGSCSLAQARNRVAALTWLMALLQAGRVSGPAAGLARSLAADAKWRTGAAAGT